VLVLKKLFCSALAGAFTLLIAIELTNCVIGDLALAKVYVLPKLFYIGAHRWVNSYD
jgi:hypothetical protein